MEKYSSGGLVSNEYALDDEGYVIVQFLDRNGKPVVYKPPQVEKKPTKTQSVKSEASSKDLWG